MTSQQYEELCRYFVAHQLQMDVGLVRTGNFVHPTRAEMHDCRHQIDLYWEVWNFLTPYLIIANAKWRAKGCIGHASVLLLRQVQRSLGAHKAVLMTNSRFSGAAQKAAEEEGIGLLIVRPTFAAAALPALGRGRIQAAIQEAARGNPCLYAYEPVLKGLTRAAVPCALGSFVTEGAPAASRRVGAAVSPEGLPANKQLAGPDRSGGYPTRQGPGPGFCGKVTASSAVDDTPKTVRQSPFS